MMATIAAQFPRQQFGEIGRLFQWLLDGDLEVYKAPKQVKTTLIVRLWGIKIKPPSMPLFPENKT